MLPRQAYTECAKKFMQNFCILPWYSKNTPSYQAILHQILLVRLLVELWSNGPGRQQRCWRFGKKILPANELLKVCKRPLSPDDRSRSRSNTQRRRGQRPEDRGADREVPELLNLIARLTLRHEDTLAVLLQQNQFILHMKAGTRQSSAFDDGKESELARRKSQDHIIEEQSCIIDDGYTDREGDQTPDSTEGRGTSHGRTGSPIFSQKMGNAHIWHGTHNNVA